MPTTDPGIRQRQESGLPVKEQRGIPLGSRAKPTKGLAVLPEPLVLPLGPSDEAVIERHE